MYASGNHTSDVQTYLQPGRTYLQPAQCEQCSLSHAHHLAPSPSSYPLYVRSHTKFQCILSTFCSFRGLYNRVSAQGLSLYQVPVNTSHSGLVVARFGHATMPGAEFSSPPVSSSDHGDDCGIHSVVDVSACIASGTECAGNCKLASAPESTTSPAQSRITRPDGARMSVHSCILLVSCCVALYFALSNLARPHGYVYFCRESLEPCTMGHQSYGQPQSTVFKHPDAGVKLCHGQPAVATGGLTVRAIIPCRGVLTGG